MKKIPLVGLVFGALIAPAVAADMPLKAPVYTKAPPPALVFSWTGFYVGGNIGGLWSNSNIIYTANPGFFTSAALISSDGSPRLRSTSFTGGFQAGANWQTGALVIGLETDINAASVRNSAVVTRGAVPGLPSGYTVSESVNSNWLFTLRPRAGVAFDRVLLYATGGLAVANNNFTQSSVFPDCPCGITGSASGTKTGWTLGGGLEWAFAPAWSMKVEYLYVDLGTQSFADNLGAFGFPTASFTHQERLTENIGRVGVNYRF